jgi:hypothetical protein
MTKAEFIYFVSIQNSLLKQKFFSCAISDGVLVYSCGCTEVSNIAAVSALTEK